MVGIVIVSHSNNLAKSIVELTKMMAPEALTAYAGGLEDGSFGTSFDKIKKAVESVYSKDGVIILMDMGSAVMTTEMVIESFENMDIRMADCPIVEGALTATINAVNGLNADNIMNELKQVKNINKF